MAEVGVEPDAVTYRSWVGAAAAAGLAGRWGDGKGQRGAPPAPGEDFVAGPGGRPLSQPEAVRERRRRQRWRKEHRRAEAWIEVSRRTPQRLSMPTAKQADRSVRDKFPPVWACNGAVLVAQLASSVCFVCVLFASDGLVNDAVMFSVQRSCCVRCT